MPWVREKLYRKTQTTLFNRTKQHGWEQKDSAILGHFNECANWEHIVNIFECTGDRVETKEFQINAVRQNIKIIGRSDNWLKLLFMESLYIKERKPELNSGLKASKELALF